MPVGPAEDFRFAGILNEHKTPRRRTQGWLLFSWLDTNDMNDGVNRSDKLITNNVHYLVKGCELLGRRFANQAIRT